jgi:hypothetical protein
MEKGKKGDNKRNGDSPHFFPQSPKNGDCPHFFYGEKK